MAGTSNGYIPFIDKNGVTQGSVFSNRLFEASDVYNDILLHLKGKLSDTATVNVDLDFQNYLTNLENTARAGENHSLSAASGTNWEAYNTHVYQAYLDAPGRLGPLGGAAAEDRALRHPVHQVDAEAGRCRHLHATSTRPTAATS